MIRREEDITRLSPPKLDQTQPNLENRIIAVIAAQMHRVDPAKVIPSASFSDDLCADSLDTVEVIMALEDAFDIEILDVDAERIRTVRHAIDYVTHALRSTAAHP